jgi:hypothetical protein
MSIRNLLVALPFALGIACAHSSKSQAPASTVGSPPDGPQASEQYGSVVTTAGTESSGKDQGGTGSSSDGSSAGGSSMGSSSGGSKDAPGGAATGEQKEGSMGSGGSSETMGTDKSSEGGSAMGSSDMSGHAADHAVSGKLTKVSKKAVTITPKGGGSPMTLKIADQTVVTMNGKPAKASQLKAGQQVRASFQEEAAEEVAVKIDVSSKSHAKSGTSGHPQGTGSGGSQGGGSSDMGGPSGSSGGGTSQ